jgi:alkylation response protein AidB-like acyl-CoA dehydrogenase
MRPAEFRDAVRSWVADHSDWLPTGPEQEGGTQVLLARQQRIQRMLFDVGLMRWGWPERAGGLGGPPTLRAILGEELTGRWLVHTATWSMHEVLGPAVIEYGQPSLVTEVFPRLLRGDEFWCQGFSEPDAGSDLGSLRTTARRDGGSWVLNGEKLWTSFAHHASRCVVLARTGAPGSGSRGLSAFLVDMDCPGIGVRPLRTMADVDEFCSISLTEVVVPGERLLGVPEGGWRIAGHILSCERGPIFWQRGAWLAYHLDQLVGMARDDRSRALAGEAFQLLWAFRARSMATQRRIAGGTLPGPEASVDKIMIAAADQAVFETARELLGGDLEASDSPAAAAWRREWAYSRAATIYGGTSEIQKDIVSLRLLGLPRRA